MGSCDIQIVDVRRSREDYITGQVTHQTELKIDDPLAVVDIDEVVERYTKWYKLLPRVQLFYALKCNNDEAIVSVLARMGSSFDCASKSEIQQILDFGVDPSRIIYANPCKQMSHITYAREYDVDLMTFDNEEELVKIKMFYGPSARLVLRFRPATKYKVMYSLAKKFGCAYEEAEDLLKSAKNKGLNVVGVSFHVGSNCQDADAFSLSIKEARRIFDIGLQVGFAMTLLDIGGGYRGRDIDRPAIEENADVINKCLDEYFPDVSGVKIIAEPGRYLVESAVNEAAKIIGRKLIYDNDKSSIEHVMYNINDGLYGSLSWVREVTEVFVASPVTKKVGTEMYSSTVWGPTCCSLDCLATDIKLPLIEVGDWIDINYAGSYTFSLWSNFNSMPPPKMFYFCSRETWSLIEKIEMAPVEDRVQILVQHFRPC
ncbi:ornithine decarboxylase-like [Pecten maximus]|uniref:ornithine decarboxylase-like n=1 Tax=Pecten maximus TaxID=6579 RepID=UPI001458E24E|nr:ornithine decarboxylase-like [Pecten maximus]